MVAELAEKSTKAKRLREHDEGRFEERAARAARTKVHAVIPHHFFSSASSECRELFIDGHYYGCISLVQAVAEGLSKFLCRAHGARAKKDCEERVRRLQRCGAITPDTRDRFIRVWGTDRNTFHHVNEDIATDRNQLEQRAEECINLLYQIESDVFGYDFSDGKLVPKRPKYWPKSGPDQVEVFLRAGGH